MGTTTVETVGSRRSLRSLRRSTRSLLRELDIRPPLSVSALCERLSLHRERPIRLRSFSFEVPGPFGMWIATAGTDFVFYQRETTPSHQNHIILHEVGHLLAGHEGNVAGDLAEDLLPNLPPDAVRRGLRRDSYDSAHEREAELVATIIMEWASVLDHVSLAASSAPEIEGMRTALDDRQGWL